MIKTAKGFGVLVSISVILFLFASFLDNKQKKVFDLEESIDKFQIEFLRKESSSYEFLQTITEDFRNRKTDLLLDEKWVRNIHQKYFTEGKILVITEADSILFLSNNSLPINHNNLPLIQIGLEFIHNGWYYIQTNKFQGYNIQIYCLIKKEYRYRNRFLVNTFHNDFQIPDSFRISLDSADGIPIFNTRGDFALSLLAPPEESLVYESGLIHFLSIFISILGFSLILLLIVSATERLIQKKHIISGLLFFILSITLGRVIMFLYSFPSSFYEGNLFSASQYATSNILPSLGDLFINVIFINFIIYFLYFQRDKIVFKLQLNYPNRFYWVYSFIFIFLLASYAYLIIYLLEGLVINSHLNLNVSFIFNLDIYSIVGFLIIAGFFFSYYFLSMIVFYIVAGKEKRSRWMLASQSILFIVVILIACLLFQVPIFFLGLFTFSVIIFLFDKGKGSERLSLSHLIISFFFFALISTHVLFQYNKEKELSKRQNVALRISSEHDPIAEYLFLEIEKELFDDIRLKSMIINNPLDEKQILTYLKSVYFNEFWSKYDMQVTTCAPGEELIFKPFDVLMVCDDYFKNYIEAFGRPTLSKNFFYLDNNTGRNSYITFIPVNQYPDTTKRYTIYIEFEAKFIPKELGFPELLVDEQIDITRNLGDYSYAIYKHNKLTNRFGTFLYSVNSGVYGETDETFRFFEQDGYSHLLYQRDEDIKVVVSKPRETMLQKVAPFSYLFILFLIMTIGIWLLTVWLRRERVNLIMNFKKRLQFSMIAIVLISVVAIGGASAWFIFNIYKNKNEAFINEKAHSVLIELENRLSEEPFLDDSYSDYLRELLISLSNVFFTDINIYHPQGVLLASSRPRVFEEGLISTIINPIAYNQLKIRRKSLFVHNERIGNLEYISAYVPLRNIDSQIIAYINLPYFAQQSELRNEISYFLVAFINIYLLLLLLTIILAFFISNYVTRPLQIIKDSLSSLTLGKTNNKIEWSKNDEIGQLVSEYNRMIDELEVSAELLARSERESAWREMAKQVAHEIKNPLTPMRLSVQYLQRAWKDKAADWDERLDKFAKTMVEQIDTLSLIASQFSDFAKRPVQDSEIINLNEFIPEVLDLYNDFDKISIKYQPCGIEEKPFIRVDKKQLLRVFNNLIKNSIQAYNKNEVAEIIISCSREDKYLKMEIQDYGSGIPDNLKKNIFQPYFTTKTAGMGLGLAMVKSIIQSFNGNITFESKFGVGTRFIIRVPVVNETSESDPKTRMP
jgi:two-component system, NtrC family, nitrogen regulation sensor histidine kinase NtrY